MILAIDPGKTGAYAMLWRGWETPIQVGKLNSHNPNEVLRVINLAGFDRVFVEDVFLHGVKLNPKVMLNHAKNIGMIEGICWQESMPCELVPPKTWQSQILAEAGQQVKGAGNTKPAALRIAKLHGVDCGKNHNMADAVCLALYGEAYQQLGMGGKE